MKKNNYLSLKLNNFLQIIVKTFIFTIGLNILLATIFISLRDEIYNNKLQDIGFLNFKNI